MKDWFKNLLDGAIDIVGKEAFVKIGGALAGGLPTKLIDAIEALPPQQQAEAYNFIFDNSKALTPEIVTVEQGSNSETIERKRTPQEYAAVLLPDLALPNSVMLSVLTKAIEINSVDKLMEIGFIRTLVADPKTLAVDPKNEELLKNTLTSIKALQSDKLDSAITYLAKTALTLELNNPDKIKEDGIKIALTAYRDEPALNSLIEPIIISQLADVGITANRNVLPAIRKTDPVKVAAFVAAFTQNDEAPKTEEEKSLQEARQAKAMESLNSVLGKIDAGNTEKLLDWAIANPDDITNGNITEAMFEDLRSASSQLAPVFEEYITNADKDVVLTLLEPYTTEEGMLKTALEALKEDDITDQQFKTTATFLVNSLPSLIGENNKLTADGTAFLVDRFKAGEPAISSIIEPMIAAQLAPFISDERTQNELITALKDIEIPELTTLLQNAVETDLGKPENLAKFIAENRGQTEVITTITDAYDLPPFIADSFKTMDEGNATKAVEWALTNQPALTAEDADINKIIRTELLKAGSALLPVLQHVVATTSKSELLKIGAVDTILTDLSSKNEMTAGLISALRDLPDEEFKDAFGEIIARKDEFLAADDKAQEKMFRDVVNDRANPLSKVAAIAFPALIAAAAATKETVEDSVVTPVTGAASNLADRATNLTTSILISELAESMHKNEDSVIATAAKEGLLLGKITEPQLDAALVLVKGSSESETRDALTWLLDHTDEFAALTKEATAENGAFLLNALADAASPARTIFNNMKTEEGRAALETLVPAEMRGKLDSFFELGDTNLGRAIIGSGLLQTLFPNLADGSDLDLASMANIPTLFKILSTETGNGMNVSRALIADLQTNLNGTGTETVNIATFIDKMIPEKAQNGIAEQILAKATEFKVKGATLKDANALVDQSLVGIGLWTAKWARGDFKDSLPEYNPDVPLNPEQLKIIEPKAAAFVRQHLEDNKNMFGVLGSKQMLGIPDLFGMNSNPLDHTVGYKAGDNRGLMLSGVLSTIITTATGDDASKQTFLNESVAKHINNSTTLPSDMDAAIQKAADEAGISLTDEDKGDITKMLDEAPASSNMLTDLLKGDKGWAAFAAMGAAAGYGLAQSMGLGFIGTLFMIAIGYALGGIVGASPDNSSFGKFGLAKKLGEGIDKAMGNDKVKVPTLEQRMNHLEEKLALENATPEQRAAFLKSLETQLSAEALSELNMIRDGENFVEREPSQAKGTIVNNGKAVADAATNAAAALKNQNVNSVPSGVPAPPSSTPPSAYPDAILRIVQ